LEQGFWGLFSSFLAPAETKKKPHLIPEIAKGAVNSGKRLPGTAPSSSSR